MMDSNDRAFEKKLRRLRRMVALLLFIVVFGNSIAVYFINRELQRAKDLIDQYKAEAIKQRTHAVINAHKAERNAKLAKESERHAIQAKEEAYAAMRIAEENAKEARLMAHAKRDNPVTGVPSSGESERAEAGAPTTGNDR